MFFFDTHCHLQDERINNRVASIIEQAKNNGVCRFLCCGTTEKDWDDVAALARTFPEIIPAFGLHPWYIQKRSSVWQEKLIQLLTEFQSASVGEIGLDYYIINQDADNQQQVFRNQLEIAAQFKRPVSIHCRKAWGDLLLVLTSIGGLQNGGAIHSYSGSPEFIKPLDRLGCSFSFSGSVTNPRNKRAQNACRVVPVNKLLIETDSPDCPPFGYEDFNVPSTITIVHRCVAQLRDMSIDECALLLFENSTQLFGKYS